MNTAGRVPPHSEEAEQSVLGAILISEKAVARALDVLKEDDFYKEAHRAVFRVAVELFEAGEPVDIVTVSEALKRAEKLKLAGGPAYIARLAEEVPTSEHVTSYAREVADKATLRRLISTSSEILAEAMEDRVTAREILDRAETAILSIADRGPRREYSKISEVVGPTVEGLEKIYDNQDRVMGISCGLSALDRMTSGLQPKTLTVLAARPSIGKTSLALHAARVAGEAGKVVAFFSLEMGKEELATRLFCADGRLDSWSLKTGRVRGDDWSRLVNAAGRVYQLPLYIDDNAGSSILEIRARSRRIKADANGLDLIVVDYLQLMRGSVRRDASREQEVSSISRGLKALAKEMSVPVLALSQLNREVEKRQDPRPKLSDLRESGAVEQDSDVVIFIHRPKATEEQRGRIGVYELIVAKQRNGPVGVAKVYFSPDTGRWENLAHGESTDHHSD